MSLKSFKFQIFIFQIVSLCCLFSNCSSEHYGEINDFSKNQSLSFSTANNKTIYGVVVNIKADIAGKLKIVTPPCGDIILSGKQDTTIRCDWFTSKIDFNVLPIKDDTKVKDDTKGSLSIRMKFIESL